MFANSFYKVAFRFIYKLVEDPNLSQNPCLAIYIQKIVKGKKIKLKCPTKFSHHSYCKVKTCKPIFKQKLTHIQTLNRVYHVQAQRDNPQPWPMQTEVWKWFVFYHLTSEPVTWITKERKFSQSIDSSYQKKKKIQI